MKKTTPELINLFYTQFLGALNDNIFKNALVILITYQSISLFGLKAETLVAFSGGIFILPFFLFSGPAGELSEKYDKANIARLVKIFEIAIMILAAVGFYAKNYYLLMIVLFFLGTHSTFFGPIKYSLIPTYSNKEYLVFSNALVSSGSFAAILIGTISGGLLGSGEHLTWPLKFVLIIIATLGYHFSKKLPAVPPTHPEIDVHWNITRSIKRSLRLSFENKKILALLFGLSWFWFLGAGILTLVPLISKNVFHAKESVATLFLFVFTLGMGIGPFLLDRFTKGKVVHLIIPLSLLVLTLFMFDAAYVIKKVSESKDTLLSFDSLTLSQFFEVPGSYRFLFDLFLISIGGGIFTVPQYAEIQHISSPKTLSRVIGANNLYNAVFMVSVSILLMVLLQANLPLSVIFGFLGVLNIGAVIVLSFFYRDEFNKYWRF